MLIRYASADDLDLLAAAEAAGFPAAEAAPRETLRARLAAWPDCFWLLFRDGALASFVDGPASRERDLTDRLYENASLCAPRGDWQMLFGVVTAAPYRGLGCASLLLRLAAADAKVRGCRGVVLACKEALVPFYARLGYRDEGVSASSHGGAVWRQMRLTF
jgi:GNAT superfamily N-acetyltransferase